MPPSSSATTCGSGAAATHPTLAESVWLNGVAFTIVGIAPDGFTGLDQFTRYDFFVPLTSWLRLVSNSTLGSLDDRGFRNLSTRGRLKRGVTLAQAQAELSVIAADLERAFPETNRDVGLIARTQIQNRIAEAPPSAMRIAMLTLLAGPCCSSRARTSQAC